jgi:hypothetical protein
MMLLGSLWWLLAAGQLGKYLGPGAALAALPLALLAFGAYPRWRDRLAARDGAAARRALRLLALVAALVFAILYPVAAAHLLGPGSERGPGLDRALAALLSGHNPYGARTPLGHPIDALPGSLLFALPFHLLGAAALQNPVWLALLILRSAAWFARPIDAVAFSALVLVNPGFMQDYATGGDFFASAIAVFLAADLAMSAYERERASGRKLAAILLLALALNTRPIYAVALPVIAAQLGQRAGWREAARFAAAVAALSLALELPFYLADPAGFTPLTAVRKAAALPGAVWILPPLAALSTGIAFALRLDGAGAMALIGTSLAIMLLPPVLAEQLRSGFTPGTLYALPAYLFLGPGLFGAVALRQTDSG